MQKFTHLSNCAVLGLSLCAAMVLAGCSRNPAGPDRWDVSGEVLFNGQPVPFGSIQFLPDSTKGNRGPAGYATIQDGKFDTLQGGRGSVGGAHEVVINGSKEMPKNDDSAPAVLFSNYRTKIELPQETSVQNFEVPGQP